MITETKNISMQDGTKLHCSIVENGSPVWLVVTHGLGEHGARHGYFFKYFSQYFNICIYDLRGHGKSEGKRGFASEFGEFTDDLGEIISYLKSDYSLNRYVLFGHSMGGLVTASYMQKKVDSNLYPEKVFLSAPATSGAGVLGDLFRVAPLGFSKGLASLGASFPLGGMLDLNKLSHDPRVKDIYIADELNVLKVHTKLLLSILAEAREVFSKPLRINCDLYCAQGSDDVIVGANACISYFNEVEKNAVLFINDGAYHEMHNEIQKYQKPYMDFLKKSLMASIYS